MSGPTIVPPFICRYCHHRQDASLLSSRQHKCVKCRMFSPPFPEGLNLDDGAEHGLETTWRNGQIVSVKWI